MSDLISRQAAIDATELLIKDLRKDTVDVMNFGHNYNHGVADAIATIKHLPSAERWIPVTERLPAYGEEVLLSMNGDCGIGYLVPTYDERRYEWHHLGLFYYLNEVIAWMPLPEPYKGGEEE